MTTPLWRRKWLLLAVAGAVLACAGVGGFLLLRKRRAAVRKPVAAPPTPRSPAVAALAKLQWNPALVPDFTRPLPAQSASASGHPPGYVGSAACTPCHAKLVASYQRHSMARTGLRPLAAVDQAMLRKAFDGAEIVVQKQSGYSYRPFRDGERYFVEEFADAPDGTRLHSLVKPITMTLSAGSYGVAFAFQQGSRVWQVPVDYNPQAGHWGLDPGYQDSNPRFSRPISGMCISCHSDTPLRRAGTLEFFQGELPAGVGCERCHGPGARHAETGAVADIINPARLPAAQQLDVCAQCHLEGRSSERAGRDVFSYRPGEPLHGFRHYYVEEPAPPDSFPLLGHSERLVRSACYQAARDTLTCTTCHDPHASSLERKSTDWDKGCAKCHTAQSCTGDAAERAKVADHCVGCHMRRATPADVKLLTMTDHWIQRRPAPPGAPDAPTRRERGDKAKGMVAYTTLVGQTPTPGDDLGAIEGVAAAEFGFFERGATLLVDGMKGWPRVPRAHVLLAQAFEAIGQPWNAARAYEALLATDIDHRLALLGYARLLLASGPPESHGDAIKALDRLIAIAPDDSDALEAKGIQLMLTGQDQAAEPVLRAAVAASPVAGKAETALAVLALRAKDVAGAVAHLEQARGIAPWDRWVLEQLRDGYGALGKAAQQAEIERVLGQSARQLGRSISAWMPEAPAK